MYPNAPHCPSGTITYTIRPGDTLYNIAIRYNTTVPQIMAANPNVNPNFLMIGQIICVPTGQNVPSCPGGTLYTIQSGDTLYNLAIRYNTTVNAIISANPGINPNALRIGQVICIPGATPPATCPQGSFSYQIKSGDTLYSLANRYNTTVNAILAINPGINPNALQIGQSICIPGAQPGVCPPNTFSYTIQAGDSFYQLALRYNTTVQAIQQANPGVNPNQLQIGQKICIPN